FLPQLVGLRQALAWCLTGRVFDAAEALQGGLLNEVVEPDALMDRALELAHEIADNTAPVSVALTRQLLWRFGPDTHPFEALRHDGRFAMELGKSDDVKEGVAAFLEKRAPHWRERDPGDVE
ncbi:MAG: enoyl-CoA hydratase, partial [Erythrobacter sp.]|nr:enoyl-CoA hydratase [Erythrobacter sp.]